MSDPILNSIPDTLLFAVPFIFVMLVALFRLDEILGAPRRGYSARRPMCGLDANGEPILCDPDGRRVPPITRRRPLIRRRSIIINR